MIAKEFCERYGICPQDTAWIGKKYDSEDLSPVEWYNLVKLHLKKQPSAVALLEKEVGKQAQEALQKAQQEMDKSEAKSKPEKTDKKANKAEQE